MLVWIAAGVAAWGLLAALAPRVLAGPRGDFESGFVMLLVRLYARLVHRIRIRGAMPRGTRDQHGVMRAGPMIVVANHTAGVDPALLQAVCDYEITWMMAADMMSARLDPIWKWVGVIPVDRRSRSERVEAGDGTAAAGDARAIREAMRVLRSGGVIGVFPEGGIERPPRRIMPFLPGVGMLALRGAKPSVTVVPVIIEGTPNAATAWGSLYRRGRVTITVLDVVQYHGSDWTPEEVTLDLRRRMLEATGWPENNEPKRTLVRA
jgi:1-acyl-sn-glycerol-3-phosphate acyltransferase